MSGLRVLAARVAALFRRRRLEAELEEELAFHFEELVAENLRRGLPPAEARRRARLTLGGTEQIKEVYRERRGLPWLETLGRDLCHAVRRLGRERGFTTVAVLTMALAIGTNTAIFSLLRGVVLRPLPYPEPERLVRVFETNPANPEFPVSPLNFVDYQRESRAFSGLAAYTREDLELSSSERPERLAALRVTPSYFEVLGARPVLGRGFRESETVGTQDVVVLSHGLWQRRFGGDRGIVGGTIRLHGRAWTVVGVMPEGFEHVGGTYRSTAQGESVDAWWPVELDPDVVGRGSHYLNVVGRLAPGATLPEAEGELDGIAADLEARYPDTNRDWRVTLRPLHEEVVGGRRPLLLVLTAAVGFVLLIACANVASLLLARASARRREVAVRTAIGASRGRLVQQVLAESLVLAAAGAGVGLAVAAPGIPALTALMPADFPRLHAIRLDGAVLGFTAGLSALTAFAFGLVPALQSGRTAPQSALAEGGSRGGDGRATRRLRSILVVAEITLASALLVAAGLLLRSFVNLQASDPGFEPEGVLTFSVSLPGERYPEPPETADLVRRLIERLEALPGVEAAGAGTYLPWSGWDENTGFGIVDDPVERDRGPNARYGAATPGWFRALGTPLVGGRPLGAADARDRPTVVVVNRALAERYFPDGEAVGMRLDLWGEETEIVGVVGSVKDSPDALEAEPALFWPHAQMAYRTVSVAVRTAGDPAALAPAVRRAVAELDPELPVGDLRTLDRLAAAALGEQRFLLALVALFAGVAVALAAVGTYGVLAYSVSQRSRELGVRMALGADGPGIVRLVVGHGLRLTAAGLGLGVVLALVLSRLLVSLLYGVSPADPATFGAAAATALLMGALASYVPAARAARADPLAALRVE